MKNLYFQIGFLTIFFSLLTFFSKAQIITTVAGGGLGGDGDMAISAQLGNTSSVALDKYGNIFIADTYNNRIRKVSTNGIITTVAGNGIYGYSGDGDSATKAELEWTSCVIVDSVGNLFIADYGNGCIRKVNKNGIISTVVGNGMGGFGGDGGIATNAKLSSPTSVALDKSGNIYIADFGNNRIRKVDTNGIISTVAGNGITGYGGDGDSATAAKLNSPSCVAVDANGNLFIADEFNHVIRKVNTNGIISTVAGNGISGYNGDGGVATNARLNYPTGVNIDASGNLFIADEYNNRIRKVNTNGIISTVAGNGKAGFSGDRGNAMAAQLDNPVSIALDSVGNFYIADYSNQRIRKVTYTSLLVVITNYELRVAGAKEVVNCWHTATELSTSHFVVQRSTDGNSFTDIGSVRAKGSGNNSYSYVDAEPPFRGAGGLYYRIKAIDKDGASTYSQVVSVQLTIDNYQLSIIPNPSRDVVTVMGSNITSVQVIDNMGRVVKGVSLNHATNPTLSVKVLPAGVYHLRIQTADGKVSGVRFVKE